MTAAITIVGDCANVLPALPPESFRCCVTSPPYWRLRDYGHPAQIGNESTPDEYVKRLVSVFSDVRRALAADGTLWLNLGDCYANDGKWGGSTSGKHASGIHGASGNGRAKVETGLKPKDLIGMPWRVAFALQADGWYLRSDIIWAKPNPMPESVTDRPTKAHEYVFLLSKSERYFYDAKAIAERGAGYDTRNKRTVWTVGSEPCGEAHFAVMPSALVVPCVLAGSEIGDSVLDPFGGSGTVGRTAVELGRNATMIELNKEYARIAERLTRQQGLFGASELAATGGEETR